MMIPVVRDGARVYRIVKDGKGRFVVQHLVESNYCLGGSYFTRWDDVDGEWGPLRRRSVRGAERAIRRIERARRRSVERALRDSIREPLEGAR